MKDRIDERRGMKRRHLLFYLDVINRRTDAVLGQLGDISIDGILIVSKEPIPIDEIFAVCIRFPDIEGFRGEKIQARVRTKWKSPDTNTELLNTGCQFLDLDSEAASQVRQLIQVLGFRE